MKNKINKKSVLTIIGVILTYVIIYGLTKTKVINSYYAGIINLALINIMLAVSLNLIVGFTGQLCLGHAGFMSIGLIFQQYLLKKLSFHLWFLYLLVQL